MKVTPVQTGASFLSLKIRGAPFKLSPVTEDSQDAITCPQPEIATPTESARGGFGFLKWVRLPALA